MVIVVELAHWPAVGVNVYIVVTVLFTAGDHVPVIPLVDTVGKGAITAPLHIPATCTNVGVTIAFTVTVMVAAVAHCPAAGVKIYVVVAVLLSAGDHVPVMPLLDVVGNGDITVPIQTGATCVNSGVTGVLTVMVMVAVVAHGPALGVNV